MIFFFSGTGNTRFIASRLAEATGDHLVSIAQAMVDGKFDYCLEAGERIGFCFPIHGWRPPFIVRDFIRRLSLQGYVDGTYCYAFATCGDDVGLTYDYLTEDLNAVGIRLDSVFSVIMPETYNFPFIDQIDTPQSAERKIAAASQRLPKMIPAIVNRERGVMDINKSRWPRINSKLLGAFFLKHWVTDDKFTVDACACLHCGKCREVCPVGNISCSDDGVPQWQHNHLCTTCFACYHHCPAHAIDFDGRTRGKRQYFFHSALLPASQHEKN